MPSKNTNPDSVDDAKLDTDSILSELVTIRQLLAILLAKLGSDSGEIGEAMGLEPRRVRDWISFNAIERIPLKSDAKVEKPKRKGSEKGSNGKKAIVEEKDNTIMPVAETVDPL